MKKFLTIASVFCVLVLGLFSLTACCEKKKKVDPYANQVATNSSEFSTFISGENGELFENYHYVVSTEQNGKTSKLDFTYYTSNGKQYAHLSIEDNENSVKGDIYVNDNKMYIDNGTEKYYIFYDMWTTAYTEPEVKVFSEKIFSLRNENNAKSFIESQNALSGTILENSKTKYYKVGEEVATNYRIVYEDSNQISTAVRYSQNDEIKIALNEGRFQKVDLSHTYRITTKVAGQEDKVETTKITSSLEKFSGTIKFPNFDKYTKKEL